MNKTVLILFLLFAISKLNAQTFTGSKFKSEYIYEDGYVELLGFYTAPFTIKIDETNKLITISYKEDATKGITIKFTKAYDKGNGRIYEGNAKLTKDKTYPKYSSCMVSKHGKELSLFWASMYDTYYLN